jgi:hypothetical protein
LQVDPLKIKKNCKRKVQVILSQKKHGSFDSPFLFSTFKHVETEGRRGPSDIFKALSTHIVYTAS